VEARLGKKGGFELKAREAQIVIASVSEAIQLMFVMKVEAVPSHFIRYFQLDCFAFARNDAICYTF